MLPAALCKRYALRYSQKVMPSAGLCAKPLIGVLSYPRMPPPETLADWLRRALFIVESDMTNSAMTDSAMTAAPATEPFVTATTENGVLWLTLNRPQRRNPLSTEMIAALSQSIAAGNQDPAVKVMVITGSGPAFSAGHDLAEIQRRADEEYTAWQARVQQLLAACAAMMNSIMHSPKAIVASVQGIASAAGCQSRRECCHGLVGATAPPSVRLALSH